MDFKALLDAFGNVASVVKTIADTPGINLIPYASTVSSAVSAIQAGIKLGENVSTQIDALRDTFANGVPSQDKLDALDAKIAALRAKIHAPLPPKEEGEED
jgi:hypothetical protein